MRSAATVFLATALMLMFAEAPLHTKKPYDYIGVSVCALPCHNSEATGHQYKIWQSSGHARAVRLLSGEKAAEIAARASVAEPARDRACLSCHTTGGGKNELTGTRGWDVKPATEPGSGYYSASDHVDYIDREGAYRKAVSRGIIPLSWATAT
jgi:hypothetical protein